MLSCQLEISKILGLRFNHFNFNNDVLFINNHYNMGQTYASSVFYIVNLAIVVDVLTKITNKAC